MKRSLCAKTATLRRMVEYGAFSTNVRAAGAGCPSVGGQLTVVGGREVSLCWVSPSQHAPDRSAAVEHAGRLVRLGGGRAMRGAAGRSICLQSLVRRGPMAPNPSIEATVAGKPATAPHVER